MNAKPHALIKNAAVTAGILIASSAMNFALQLLTSEDFCAVAVFILGTAFTARFTDGYVWGILYAVVGTLLVNWAFTEPFYVLNESIARYPITFVILLTASVMISMLTTRLRYQSELKAVAEKEKLRADLLRSVSHDLRTPLTSIKGAAEAYLDNRERLPEETKIRLITDIGSEAGWLMQMVENVLAITRIDAGAPGINYRSEAAEEVIGEVVGKFRADHPDVAVDTDVPGELVMVPMDVMLVEQAMRSILEIFAKYGNGVTKIDINLMSDGSNAKFSFEDNGGATPWETAESGLRAPFTPDKVADGTRYTGIELSLCRSVVKMHGGEFRTVRGEKGGRLEFTLPLEQHGG